MGTVAPATVMTLDQLIVEFQNPKKYTLEIRVKTFNRILEQLMENADFNRERISQVRQIIRNIQS